MQTVLVLVVHFRKVYIKADVSLPLFYHETILVCANITFPPRGVRGPNTLIYHKLK